MLNVYCTVQSFDMGYKSTIMVRDDYSTLNTCFHRYYHFYFVLLTLAIAVTRIV